MKLTRVKQDKIRLAWHGTRTADQVATQFGLSVGTVRNFWTDEKKAGRLPNLPCRPSFAARNIPVEPAALAPPPAAVSRPDAPATEIDFDDCGQVFGEMPTCIPAGDPLLVRLKLAHGRDPARRLVLRVPDDRKAGNSEGELLALYAPGLARRWDDFVNSKIEERRT